MSIYEAALNLLREERRAVGDIRNQILKDDALKAEDPTHRSQLLTQTMNELTGLLASISVLGRLDAGTLIAVEVTSPFPVSRVRQAEPVRLSALRVASLPEPAATRRTRRAPGTGA